jgi:hypothetical protein
LWPRMMTECFTISDFMAVIPLLPWCGLVLITRSVLFNHREHVRVRYFQRAGGAGIFKPLLTSPCNAPSQIRRWYSLTDLSASIYKANYVWAAAPNTPTPTRIQQHHCGESYTPLKCDVEDSLGSFLDSIARVTCRTPPDSHIFLANRIRDAVLVFEKSGAVASKLRSQSAIRASLTCDRACPSLLAAISNFIPALLCVSDGCRTKERAATRCDDFSSMVKLADGLFQDHARMAPGPRDVWR